MLFTNVHYKFHNTPNQLKWCCVHVLWTCYLGIFSVVYSRVFRNMEMCQNHSEAVYMNAYFTGDEHNVQPLTSILSSIYIHTSQLFWCTQGDSFGWRQSPLTGIRSWSPERPALCPQNFSSTSSCWMVVVYGYYWLVVWNIVYCSIQLGTIIPTDFHIFQRDRSTTNQRLTKHVLVATVELKNGS